MSELFCLLVLNSFNPLTKFLYTFLFWLFWLYEIFVIVRWTVPIKTFNNPTIKSPSIHEVNTLFSSYSLFKFQFNHSIWVILNYFNSLNLSYFFLTLKLNILFQFIEKLLSSLWMFLCIVRNKHIFKNYYLKSLNFFLFFPSKL